MNSTSFPALSVRRAFGYSRFGFAILLVVASLGLEPILADSGAPSGIRIKKVLPHLLDKQGRHLLSPSLLERDAYQALLRKEPERRGGLQFDVQCGTLPSGVTLRLKAEVRGSLTNTPTQVTVEQPLPANARFHRWQVIRLSDDQYRQLGELVAWRISLWNGDRAIAEQKSFLW